MATRRHHPLRTLLIVVLVLAGLLVAADRIGVVVTEHVAANKIRSTQGLSSTPDVNIAGFPFLTQLAGRAFGQITVTAADVPISTKFDVVDFTEFRAVLHTVTVARDFSSGTARTADGVALIGYRELGDLLHVGLTYAGNGRVQLHRTITVLGNSLTVAVSAAPVITDGVLAFGSTAINGLGAAGREVAAALNKVFDLTIPLDSLPFQVKIRSLTVDAAGLAIALTGSNLSFAR